MRRLIALFLLVLVVFSGCSGASTEMTFEDQTFYELTIAVPVGWEAGETESSETASQIVYTDDRTGRTLTLGRYIVGSERVTLDNLKDFANGFAGSFDDATVTVAENKAELKALYVEFMVDGCLSTGYTFCRENIIYTVFLTNNSTGSLKQTVTQMFYGADIGYPETIDYSVVDHDIYYRDGNKCKSYWVVTSKTATEAELRNIFREVVDPDDYLSCIFFYSDIAIIDSAYDIAMIETLYPGGVPVYTAA